MAPWLFRGSEGQQGGSRVGMGDIPYLRALQRWGVHMWTCRRGVLVRAVTKSVTFADHPLATGKGVLS